MSTRFNDQWALLGTHWTERARRGRTLQPHEVDTRALSGTAGERPKSTPARRGSRRHKRPAWIDRDT